MHFQCPGSCTAHVPGECCKLGDKVGEGGAHKVSTRPGKELVKRVNSNYA